MRKMLRRLPLLLVFLGIALTGLSSSAASVRDEKSSGAAELKEIVIGWDQNLTPVDWIHAVVPDLATLVNSNVAERLADISNSGKLVPVLATRWVQRSPSNLRVFLRRGIKFTNGEPFNADSVVFSTSQLALLTAQRGVALSAELDRVVKVNAYTVDFFTKNPSPDFMRTAEWNVFMYPPKFASNPANLQNRVIGTGPYLFKSQSATSITLVKNHKYWGGVPTGPERVRIVSRVDLSSRIAGLQSGELQAAHNMPADSLKVLPAAQVGPPRGTAIIQINPYVGITANEKVRQAIVQAIDTEGLRKGLLPPSLSQPGRCQFAVPGVLGFNPNLKNPAYDPARARTLLASAGVGNKLTLAGAVGGELDGALEVVAQQLRQVGFDVTFTRVPPSDYSKAITSPKEQRPQMWGTTATYSTGTVIKPWVALAAKSGRVSALPPAASDAFEPLFARVLSEFNPARRQALFNEASKLICDAYNFLYLYASGPITGLAKSVRFTPVANQVNGEYEFTSFRSVRR